MNKDIDILKQARKDKKFTQTEMAKKLGIGLRMYQRIEEGHIPKYKTQHILKIDNILGTHLYESIYDSLGKQLTHKTVHEHFMEVPYLPIYAQFDYIQNYTHRNILADKNLPVVVTPKENETGCYMVIEVEGDKMDDGTNKAICDGDKLLVKEIERLYWGHKKFQYTNYLFVLITKKMGIFCTQIKKHNIEKRSFTCHTRNQLYSDVDVSLQEVHRLFIIKKIVERKIRL